MSTEFLVLIILCIIAIIISIVLYIYTVRPLYTTNATTKKLQGNTTTTKKPSEIKPNQNNTLPKPPLNPKPDSNTTPPKPDSNTTQPKPQPKPNQNGTQPKPPKPNQNGTQPKPPKPNQNNTQPKPPKPNQNNTQPKPPKPNQNNTQPKPNSNTDSSQAACLALHNSYRAKMGLGPLVSGTADQIACANKVAQQNYLSGKPHTNTCKGSSQNECPHFSSLEQCLQAYFAEGAAPGLSHYNNIKNARTSVSCGVYNEPGGKYYYSHQYV